MFTSSDGYSVAKSTKPFNTDDIGNIILGKYIFETKLEFVIRLWVDELIPSEIKFQIITPDKTKSVYGIPEESNPASLLKINVKIIVDITGRKTAHAVPSNVCLYLTLTSLQTKK